MQNRVQNLSGLRILVLEDEVMIAMMLEDMLQDFGCDALVVGIVTHALSLIRGSTFDGALLDMNIRGENTTAVAEELVSRSVPFLLVTGYGVRETESPVFKTAPRVQKPFSQKTLNQRMAEVFASTRPGLR